MIDEDTVGETMIKNTRIAAAAVDTTITSTDLNFHQEQQQRDGGGGTT